MITQEEAKKLLAKKRLSGHEAGRLWMEDSRLVEWGHEGLLTEKELRYMRSLLRAQEDMEIYNSYLETYKRASFALKTAQVISLIIQSYLLEESLRIKEALDKGPASRQRTFYRVVRRGKDYALEVGDLPLESSWDYVLPATREEIAKYLAYEKRIGEISEYTEVDFSQEIRLWKLEIQRVIDIYNFYLADPRLKIEYVMADTEKLMMEKIRLDRKTYKYLLELIPPLKEKEVSDGQ